MLNYKEQIIKEFTGHSGSKIFLIKNDQRLFVRKLKNVERNLERLSTLNNLGFNVPKLISFSKNHIDMEYIHGLDMISYMKFYNLDKLKFFLLDTLESFSLNSANKDYTETYYEKLKWLTDDIFPFKKKEFIKTLPKNLPQSTYHGDFTLENIIFRDDKYYMIDPLTSEYDSYIFDVIKLRQDLECKWFLRKNNINFDVKLQNIQENIFKKFPESKNDNLLILMLLRIYPYSKKNSLESKFIMREIIRLWK